MKMFGVDITRFIQISTLAILPFNAYSQADLLINEFCASNVSIVQSPEFENYSDWIEIYNRSNSAINLDGYFITDNLTIPTKYKIPSGISIEAHDYILLWADGNNAGVHLNFKLSKGGEEIGLFSPGTVLIDSIVFGPQQDDISYGRVPEDETKWEFFEPATPGEQNNISNTKNISPAPLFSSEGGFYTNSFSLTFLNADQAEIYYTLDGTIPDKNATAYSAPISIDSTMAVRATSFAEGKMQSAIITNTYFINETVNLPIISLVTDPANFFDNEIGIYVTGTNGTGGYCDNMIRNLKQDWERPVNIEFYETNGEQGFNQGAGIKIFGGCSRHRFPQKSLALYARTIYGAGSFKHQVFPEKEIKKFESFVLRSSADDQVRTFFRDALAQQVLVEDMDVDYQAYRPAAVYLNGQYWGIHNIREKINEHYIAENFDIDPGEVNILEGSGSVAFGSNAGYTDMVNDANNNDLSIQKNYDEVAVQMDINQYMDYQIGHIYLTERDWPGNNIKFWRANSIPNTKWRWINFDLDQTFLAYWVAEDMITKTTTTSGPGWPNPEWSTRLFRNLLDNEGFKNEFIQRYAFHMSTTFNPERLIGIIDGMQAHLEPEMPRHIERWGGKFDPDFAESWNPLPTFSSVEQWKENIDEMRIFAMERPAYTIQNFTNFFGLTGMAEIHVNINTSDAGLLLVNHRYFKDNYNGEYFNNIPVKLNTIPYLGYTFSHWERETDITESAEIIGKGAEWKYLDTGEDLVTSWLQNSFDDSGWQTGLAQLGYGDGDEATVIDFGPDDRNKYITSYFRKAFEIEDTTNYISYSVSVLVDDGAVLYINGNEVCRVNMPTGEIDYLTLAEDFSRDENAFSFFNVPRDYLVLGNNVIQVEVHQSSAESSDVSFDCSLSGTYKAGIERETYYTPELELSFNANTILNAFFTEDTNQIKNPVVISEINYNSSADHDSEDWVEIYNNSGKAFDMTGWKFQDGTDQTFHFPNDYLFLQDEYLVICKNAKKFKENYPDIHNVIGDFDFGLNQNGELISLLNQEGKIVEQVHYKNTNPWPTGATGTGMTIELENITTDNNDGGNWVATNLYGTPGRAYEIVTDIEKFDMPVEYALEQNYPNPFSSATTIPFVLSDNNLVTLSVYDIAGRKIAGLVNEYREAGKYEIPFNPENLESGLYYYRLTVGNQFVETKKMLLLK